MICRFARRYLTSLMTLTLLFAALNDVSAHRPLSLPSGPPRPTKLPQDAELLQPGAAVQRDLKPKETHIYRIILAADQFLRVQVEPRGINVTLAIFGPDKLQLIGVASAAGTQQSAAVVALTSGTHYLGVQPLGINSSNGSYALKVAELRQATATEKESIGADAVYGQGDSLYRSGTREGLLAAIDKLELSQRLYGGGGNLKKRATALNRLGMIYSALGKHIEALEKLELALSIRHELHEFASEAATLNNLGEVYSSSGDKRAALTKFEQAFGILNNLGESVALAIILDNLGAIHSDLGEKSKALEYYERALSMHRRLNDPGGEATTLNNVGKVYDDLGQRPLAIEKYESALSLAVAGGDKVLEAALRNNLGSAQSAQGNKEKALEYYTQTLNLYRASGNQRGEAVTLSNIGAVYSDLGQKQKAIEYFEQALPLHRQSSDQAGEAATLNNEGAAYDNLGKKDKALELYTKALNLTRGIEDRRGEARTLNNLGSLFDSLGEKRKAITYYEQALSLIVAISDRPTEAVTLNNIAGIYSSLGEKANAGDRYSKALGIYREVHDRAGEATALNNLGNISADQDKEQEALDYFTRAETIFQGIPDPYRAGVTLNNIGTIYFNVGDQAKAIDNFGRALTYARQVSSPSSQASALNNLGTAYDRQGNRKEALAHFEQAITLLRALGDVTTEATTLNNLGAVYSESGDKQKALASYDEALRLSRKVGNRTQEATTLNNIGLVHYDRGERQKALECYQQALELMRSIGYLSGEAGTLSNIGLVYELGGQKQRALDIYAQAIASFEKIGSTTTIEEIKIGQAERPAATYEHAALLLIDLGRKEEAFNLTERARARALLDQMGNLHPRARGNQDPQLVEQEQRLAVKLRSIDTLVRNQRANSNASPEGLKSLENELAETQRRYEELLTRFKLATPEYASLRSVDPERLGQIQQRLSGDTTLLSYFVTPSKTLAFIVTRNSFDLVEILVSRKEIETELSSFRRFDNTNDERPEALRQLYTWLILPLKTQLKTPTIGIIPHSILHYLPFAALTDGTNYLGTQYQLFNLPSANMLKFVQGRKKAGNRLLAVAQSNAAGLSKLNYVDDEVGGIARLYGAKPFPTDTMSKEEFFRQAGNYNLIHIAAHADLNLNNPLFSRIFLATPENRDDNNSVLTVKDVYDLDLSKSWLVVLSACETQLGSYHPGDNVVGLNRALIYAGTPTVIASLWPVDDRSTSALMKLFYTNLKRGLNKVAALQAAQNAVRKQHPAPYYWSGFVLTGSPN